VAKANFFCEKYGRQNVKTKLS